MCIKGIADAMLLVIVFCFDCVYFFSEKERLQCNVFESCGCLWAYLADRRASEGGLHVHCNPFYDPLKYRGPLLPPAAALAPTIWPQFHLRWACPEEAHSGEIEAQCRKIILKNSEMQKVVIFLNFSNFYYVLFKSYCLSPFVDGHYYSSSLFFLVSLSIIKQICILFTSQMN